MVPPAITLYRPPGGTVPQEEYPSSIPFFPPITEKTIKLYTRLYAVTVAAIIAFGGLVAPVLEVKLGVGGERYWASCWHLLPAVLAFVERLQDVRRSHCLPACLPDCLPPASNS